MIVRKPKFDFSETVPRWATSLEFAHMFNAMSMLFPPLERYLNRVILMARAKITGDDPKSARLREDIDLFVRQEGMHYSIHSDFNNMLERNGFSKLPAFETEMEQEYRDLLNSRSLKFLTAYCEAFEILGPIYANIWLDGIEDLFEGGERNAVAMWRWHISEEFEHRTVAYDVYNELFGGYFYRLRVLHFSHKHQSAYIKRVLGYLLEQEWNEMTEQEIAASKRRLKAIGRRIRFLAIWGLVRVHLPFYSPRRARVPRNYKQTLSSIEEHFVRT